MIKLVTFQTQEGALVHLNPVHIVAVVGADADAVVELLTVTGVSYIVNQRPDKSVRVVLTGSTASTS